MKPDADLDVYLVGGAVRDELLGRPVADRDWVVVGLDREQLIERGFKQIGSDFPCFLHPETKEEYALARTERKSGRGYTGFICDFGPHVTLEQDLERRDLTINAIARTREGDYVDPYGGRADLEAGVLRHVSSAFAEDPLRVLRVARFAARYADAGFTVHPETLRLMQNLVESGEVAELTTERVWKELSRALTEPRPSECFRVLRECGALSVVLPELDSLFGVPQSPEHHPEIDTGVHVLLATDIARKLFDDPVVTWAVVMHDVGKGLTPEDEWPSHVGHEVRGIPLVQEACSRLKTSRETRELARLVCEHHMRCHMLPEFRAPTAMKLLEAVDAIRRPGRLGMFVQACEADKRGRLGSEKRDYPQAALLLACGEAARAVDTRPLQDEGWQGPRLAEKIRRARIKAVARVLSDSRTSPEG